MAVKFLNPGATDAVIGHAADMLPSANPASAYDDTLVESLMKKRPRSSGPAAGQLKWRADPNRDDLHFYEGGGVSPGTVYRDVDPYGDGKFVGSFMGRKRGGFATAAKAKAWVKAQDRKAHTSRRNPAPDNAEELHLIDYDREAVLLQAPSGWVPGESADFRGQGPKGELSKAAREHAKEEDLKFYSGNKRLNPSRPRGRAITLNQAKKLRFGQTIYMRDQVNSDGTSVRWRVNGAPKLWKRSPGRVSVPVKHGLRDHGYVTEDNLHLFTLKELPKVQKTRKRNPYQRPPVSLERDGIIYFDLFEADYNVEEDMDEAKAGDKDAKARIKAAYGWPPDFATGSRNEFKAIRTLEKMFGRSISNEGHDAYGALVCKMPVSTWTDVATIEDAIQANYGGGADIIYLDNYLEARGFHLYPEGVGGPVWGVAPGEVEGDLNEWLEANAPKGKKANPRRKPVAKRSNPSKAPLYRYHVTGPQGGKYLTSTFEEARDLTKNGGTIKKLKKPRKG